MRLLPVLLAFATALLAQSTEGTLGEGTDWATPFFVQAGAASGPTVVIVGGLHGDEPAGAIAAGQIRRWPVRRGRLVVVPRANVRALKVGKRYTPDVEKAIRNLNRNFPRPGEQGPARGRVAPALWEFVRSHEPDWFVDLHEGFDFHVLNRDSVGSTVIAHPTPSGLAAAQLLVRTVNASLPTRRPMFIRLEKLVAGGMARAAAEHLGAQALTLETTTKDQPLSRRARQHRLMVHRLLRHLDMLDETVGADRITGAGRMKVALYDGRGCGGPGVPRLLDQLAEVEVVRVGPGEIRAGALAQFDLVVFSGGTGSGQASALGESGRAAVKTFVEGGGGYVGICAGSYLATSGFTWGLKILDAKTVSPKWRRGRATVSMELTDEGRRILGDRRGELSILYVNGPIVKPFGSDLPDYRTLAHFRTEVAKNGTPKGVMVDSPAIFAGRCGAGRVLCFSAHPEQTRGLAEMVRRAAQWAARR